jgi:hypothetical protein
MDVYNYNVAKAAVAATLFYSGTSTLGLGNTTLEGNRFNVFQIATQDSLYLGINKEAKLLRISLIEFEW